MKWFALIAVLALLAGCVQIPEAPAQPAPEQKEEAPAPQETVTPVEQPPAPNGTQPLAPLPAENKTTTVLPKAAVNTTLSSNSTTSKASGWTTEPLQIEEGETLRVVLKKTV